MFGVFGNSVSQALQSEFFQWFHLDETGQVPDGKLTRTTFQPTAAQFHDLVRVVLTVDGKQTLRGASLVIKRSFIEDPMHQTLANDITKSFLMAVLEGEDAATIRRAADQIRQHEPAGSRMQRISTSPAAGPAGGAGASDDDLFDQIKQAIDSGRPVYATSKSFKADETGFKPVSSTGGGPLAPGEGEPGYMVYTGKRRQFDQQLSQVKLHMGNGPVDGAEQLTISVTPI
jgi:hypothetical protein